MQSDLIEALLLLSLFEDVSAISTNSFLKKYMLFHDLLSHQIWKFTDLHVLRYAVTLFEIRLIMKKIHSLWLTSADNLWKYIIEAKRAASHEKELSHLQKCCDQHICNCSSRLFIGYLLLYHNINVVDLSALGFLALECKKRNAAQCDIWFHFCLSLLLN